MFGAFGSTLGHNFYMGMQNESKLEVQSEWIFYSHLQIKDTPPCLPYVYIGKPCICNVSRPHAM